jgi:peptidyl-prolyl cis-trans isomerase B (cyclophilin B)
MNPIATLHMANGRNIVIELLPESAPNTVNSFIYTASRGYLDHHAIERETGWMSATRPLERRNAGI